MTASLILLAQSESAAATAPWATAASAWWQRAQPIVLCPLLWSLILGGLGLWLLLPAAGLRRRLLGRLLAAVALGLLAAYLPLLGDWFAQAVFWLLAAVALAASVGAISSRSPVYCAVWFALSLLATAGLFLLVGAQFLAVATVAVYAGAILVMFLFVLMLAQPEGHTFYDRITWGPFAPALATLAALVIVGGLAYQQEHLDSAALAFRSPVVETPERKAEPNPLLDGKQHMAQLGVELFGRHLVEIEVAGTLLLVALVGALAIVIQGRQSRTGAQPAGEGGGEVCDG